MSSSDATFETSPLYFKYVNEGDARVKIEDVFHRC